MARFFRRLVFAIALIIGLLFLSAPLWFVIRDVRLLLDSGSTSRIITPDANVRALWSTAIQQTASPVPEGAADQEINSAFEPNEHELGIFPLPPEPVFVLNRQQPAKDGVLYDKRGSRFIQPGPCTLVDPIPLNLVPNTITYPKDQQLDLKHHYSGVARLNYQSCQAEMVYLLDNDIPGSMVSGTVDRVEGDNFYLRNLINRFSLSSSSVVVLYGRSELQPGDYVSVHFWAEYPPTASQTGFIGHVQWVEESSYAGAMIEAGRRYYEKLTTAKTYQWVRLRGYVPGKTYYLLQPFDGGHISPLRDAISTNAQMSPLGKALTECYPSDLFNIYVGEDSQIVSPYGNKLISEWTYQGYAAINPNTCRMEVIWAGPDIYSLGSDQAVEFQGILLSNSTNKAEVQLTSGETLVLNKDSSSQFVSCGSENEIPVEAEVRGVYLREGNLLIWAGNITCLENYRDISDPALDAFLHPGNTLFLEPIQ